ncbi:hypothetical protein TcasGA2_TC016401 [Tribolium castaneum]|uniref:Uncharacterized protein n=1 Tax=Tribolium castaneum TaxID=7070 RepID=D7EIY3_TRICA|nr:hypothetical protein TcasGA2_TC016401 [Tribolium castaneum]
MESYINLFLKTEITILPSLLDKYVGNYYNNTLCNGATWMFASWCILHVFFDNFLNALLKRMKYKEFIRARLQQSLCVINYGIVVPLSFGYSLVRGFTPALTISLTVLLTWLLIEFYSSALSKAAIHWINHTETDDKQNICNLNLVECSLFSPRDDVTYNFLLMRKEMKDREERCLALRKPKNKNVVFQTLKCMVAIKRKLNEKRKEAAGLSEVVNENKKEGETGIQDEHNESDSDSDGEVVGGKLEFNINCKNESDPCKCKQD